MLKKKKKLEIHPKDSKESFVENLSFLQPALNWILNKTLNDQQILFLGNSE
jgi:hypothetical protein